MTFLNEIQKAWSQLWGFTSDGDYIYFNNQPLYYGNSKIETWDELLTANPQEIKTEAGYRQTPNAKTYDELMTPENFSYGAFDWENEHGTRLGFSLGYYRLGVTDDTNCTFGGTFHGVFQNGIMQANDSNFGLGFSGDYGEDLEFISARIDLKLHYDEYYIYSEGNFYFGFYMVSKEGYDQQIACVLDSQGLKGYLYDGGPDWEAWDPNWSIDETLLYAVYFDDGRNLPDGVEWNDELRSYFVPKVKEEKTVILTTSQASNALQGVEIMTHATVWTGAVTIISFMFALFRLVSRAFSGRR